MRIHSNAWELYEAPIIAALKAEQDAGRIAPHVTFKQLSRHRSHSHMAAYEIQLQAEQPDCGRRAGNSGSYGAMIPAHDGYAATYDEWGWLLAALFRVDPGLMVGTAAHPAYDGVEQFEEITGLSYNPAALITEIRANLADGATNGEWDPYPFQLGRAGKGRVGAGRVTAERARYWGDEQAGAAIARWIANPAAKVGNQYVKYVPRTVEQVAEFAHLDLSSSASSQHFIDTGHYLHIGALVE